MAPELHARRWCPGRAVPRADRVGSESRPQVRGRRGASRSWARSTSCQGRAIVGGRDDGTVGSTASSAHTYIGRSTRGNSLFQTSRPRTTDTAAKARAIHVRCDAGLRRTAVTTRPTATTNETASNGEKLGSASISPTKGRAVPCNRLDPRWPPRSSRPLAAVHDLLGAITERRRVPEGRILTEGGPGLTIGHDEHGVGFRSRPVVQRDEDEVAR